MKICTIGVMPEEKIRARILAIAAGEYEPDDTEPKIWFTSMRSLAKVLSDDNLALLKIIEKGHPKSVSSLAEMTGKRQSNLSRTLKTMSDYGFVEMRRERNAVRPIAIATKFRILAC